MRSHNEIVEDKYRTFEYNNPLNTLTNEFIKEIWNLGYIVGWNPIELKGKNIILWDREGEYGRSFNTTKRALKFARRFKKKVYHDEIQTIEEKWND